MPTAPVQLALAALLHLSPAPPAAPELLPREVLFGNPDRSAVRISDDGRRIGWLAPSAGVLNVWVQPMEDGARTGAAHAVTASPSRPIRQWEFLPGTAQVVYLLDDGGDEDFRLYVADIDPPADGGVPRIRCLTPWEGTRTKLLAVDPRHPGEVLVANNRRDPAHFDVWRIDARTGEAREVFRNDVAWFDMFPDADWTIRVVRRFLDDGSGECLYRPDPAGPWIPLAVWGPEDAGPSKPLGVSADGKRVYVVDSSRAESGDTGTLYEVTFEAAEGGTYRQGWRPLGSDPRSEPRGILADPATGAVQAILFEHARPRWKPIDPSVERALLMLRTIGDGAIEILSRTSDGRHWAVQLSDPAVGISYWLLHREGSGATEGCRTERLFAASDAIAARRLQPLEPVTITARDGLELLAYLTLPPNFAAGRDTPVPMVLHVHGGPWTRDPWAFNPTHQWLANRGYAVLSVNFRGSTGFGKRFVNAGDRQWSKAMHDDLIDAVQWAIERGIADRAKVAIMGQSYGGYSTLVGLTFTPEVFACGVDIVGPANLRTLLSAIPAYWAAERGMLGRRVGRADETEWLESISPLPRVDRIRRPLLIGQGANDPRVPRSESDQIVQAAQARQVPVAYVVFPDEGHGFARPENRMAFMAMTEAFLARELGGRSEPVGDDVARSTARIEAGASLIGLPADPAWATPTSERR